MEYEMGKLEIELAKAREKNRVRFNEIDRLREEIEKANADREKLKADLETMNVGSRNDRSMSLKWKQKYQSFQKKLKEGEVITEYAQQELLKTKTWAEGMRLALQFRHAITDLKDEARRDKG